MAKRGKRICAKVKSHCHKGGGLKATLMKKSHAVIADIAGVGLRTPKTKKLRTKKTLVGLALKRKSKLAIARRLHIKLA